MMKLRRKLKSESGASIVIALVFFLLCLTVGAVVLTAATANAGRITRISKEQQAYFAVRSAALLLRDEVAGSSYKASYEEHESGEDGGNAKPPKNDGFDPGSVQLGTLMEAMEKKSTSIFMNTTGQPGAPAGEGTGEMTITAEDMPNVTAVYTLDDAYGVVIHLDTADGEKYASPMTLTVEPRVTPNVSRYTERWTTTKYETVDNGDGTTTERPVTIHHAETIRRETVEVGWAAGVIAKGAGG